MTLLLNGLIERHPSARLRPRREDRSGGRAERDPPLPLRQFAVWEAQRGGQRSNKCSEMEALSHVNAVTHSSASFRGCWKASPMTSNRRCYVIQASRKQLSIKAAGETSVNLPVPRFPVEKFNKSASGNQQKTRFIPRRSAPGMCKSSLVFCFVSSG